jgi:hypothetical protein
MGYFMESLPGSYLLDTVFVKMEEIFQQLATEKADIRKGRVRKTCPHHE